RRCSTSPPTRRRVTSRRRTRSSKPSGRRSARLPLRSTSAAWRRRPTPFRPSLAALVALLRAAVTPTLLGTSRRRQRPLWPASKRWSSRVAAERYIALVDAALASASAGTSTLMHRSETYDLLLDLRNEIQGLAEF